LIRQKWQENPRNFLKDNWPDIYLWDKLDEILDEFARSQRIVIPAGHGVGKTWLLARLILAFLYSYYPAKVITTAPTWNQVESVLWSEIKIAYSTAKYPLGGRLLNTELKNDPDWFAMGFSTKGNASDRQYGAASFQGFHSPNLLLIFDEAPGIEHAIWVSAASLLTGVNNKWLAFGNPTSPSGDFYEACKSPIWKKINISCFDHPNVKQGKVIIPGAVTKEWVDERRIEWGEDSPLWQAKVLGQFPTEGDDTLIPLAWAEACVGLDLVEKDNDGKVIGMKKLGVDVARFGTDRTVLAEMHGKMLLPLECVNKKDTNWTIGRIITKSKQGVEEIGVDDTGVGGGVTDGASAEGVDVEPFNFGSSAIESDKFENLRAEIYWNLREDIKNQQISLPDDKELVNELCSVKFSYTRKGRIKIESKDEIKKRLGKSPDKADAVAIVNSVGRDTDMGRISIISIDE